MVVSAKKDTKLLTEGPEKKESKDSKGKDVQEVEVKVLDNIHFQIGQNALYLRKNGEVWGIQKSYGGEVYAPMTVTQVKLIMGYEGEDELDHELYEYPDKQFIPPTEVLKEWGEMLIQYDTEALCIFGRNRKDPSKWLGVVPDQEVTGGSVDVDDFGPAGVKLAELGYQRVGTLHTHPGNMTSCSGTDTGELWNKFGGVHLIITRKGEMGFYYSISEVTWDLREHYKLEKALWKKIPERKKGVGVEGILVGEDGTTDIDQYINPPVRKNIVYKGYQYQDRSTVDYDAECGEYRYGLWNQERYSGGDKYGTNKKVTDLDTRRMAESCWIDEYQCLITPSGHWRVKGYWAYKKEYDGFWFMEHLVTPLKKRIEWQEKFLKDGGTSKELADELLAMDVDKADSDASTLDETTVDSATGLIFSLTTPEFEDYSKDVMDAWREEPIPEGEKIGTIRPADSELDEGREILISSADSVAELMIYLSLIRPPDVKPIKYRNEVITPIRKSLSNIVTELYAIGEFTAPYDKVYSTTLQDEVMGSLHQQLQNILDALVGSMTTDAGCIFQRNLRTGEPIELDVPKKDKGKDKKKNGKDKKGGK